MTDNPQDLADQAYDAGYEAGYKDTENTPPCCISDNEAAAWRLGYKHGAAEISDKTEAPYTD